MEETLKVTCPVCKSVLIIERKTGNILEVRKPILEDSSGDRFKDAFEKVRQSQAIAEEKFRTAQKKEKEKFKKLDELFNEKLKEVKEKGDTGPPDRPFDLD